MRTKPRRLRSFIERLVADNSELRKAWRGLRKDNPQSAGLSGETLAAFEGDLKNNLSQIRKRLGRGTYRFSPSKPVAVPKASGSGLRPIRVQEIRDRVVCRAIAQMIQPRLTQRLKLNHSSVFGFFGGRDLRAALHAMVTAYRRPCPWVFEADIKQFFDAVNRERLLKTVLTALNDSSINELLEDALAQEVGDVSHLDPAAHDLFPDAGIAQGNSLSPLLANAYLRPLDNAMEAFGDRYIRYADDFIVMCRTRREAQAAMLAAGEALSALDLQLHDRKSRVITVSQGFTFLGSHFNGKALRPDSKKVGLARIRMKEITSGGTAHGQHGSLRDMLNHLSNYLEGWVTAYAHCDLGLVAQELDVFLDERLEVALMSRGWRPKNPHEAPRVRRLQLGIPTIEAISTRRRTTTHGTQSHWTTKYPRFGEFRPSEGARGRASG